MLQFFQDFTRFAAHYGELAPPSDGPGDQWSQAEAKRCCVGTRAD